MCRRAHGAGYVTFFGVDVEGFRITAGEESLRWYDSSTEARRGFCAKCGSTLFFASERWAGEMHIALAHMDGPIDREPGGHVFFDSRVDWVDVVDDLPKRGGPTGTEPID
jgi:hypothetical protein